MFIVKTQKIFSEKYGASKHYLMFKYFADNASHLSLRETEDSCQFLSGQIFHT